MNWITKVAISNQDVFSHGICDTYQWHKKIWDCFPEKPEMQRNFLFRVDPHNEMTQVIIVSPIEPKKPYWCNNDCFETKVIPNQYFQFKKYYFELRANPTLKKVQPMVSDKENNQKKKTQGKRIPLIHTEALYEWLNRKAESGGFKIVSTEKLHIGHPTKYHFSKKHVKGYHSGVDFKGYLEVLDSNQFIQTFEKGIGSAKSFGFGLLVLVISK